MNALLLAALLSSFSFKAPEGWTDYTRCPDEATLAALPETVQRDARRHCQPSDGGTPEMKSAAAFAVDLRRVEQNEVATMIVAMLPGEVRLDGGSPRSFAENLAEASTQRGIPLEIVDAIPVEVGPARGAKLRFLRPQNDDRIDMYVVPHDGKTAMMSFISPNARYEQYEPVFAVTAHQSVVPDPFTPGLKVLAFVSVCLGALIGYWLLVVRRKRRPAT